MADARDENPGTGEQIGEGIGGVAGALGGAGIGSAAGPLGAIIGGVAGALGGWWAGEKVGRAAEDMNEHDDHYRSHYEKHPVASGTRYRDVRHAYALGHIAAHNPDYEGKDWDEIDQELARSWDDERVAWENAQVYAGAAYRYMRRYRAH